MRQIDSKLFPLIWLVLFLSSCQEEGNDDANAVEDSSIIEATNLTATIDKSTLLGDWILTTMEADTLVDLNGDGNGSYNILDETTCFQNTGVTFNADGTMETTVAKLDFNSGVEGDEFICTGDSVNEGTWDVEGDELIMSMEINGTTYTHRKKIAQTDSTFAFDVTKLESEQYVEDSGDTEASSIKVMAVEYTREN